jgi:transcriptional regulator of acetoin/glycerol metabolism
MSYAEELRAENQKLTASLRAADEKIKSQAAEIEALTASKSAEISKRAAAAERERIKTILTGPESEGRQTQARVLAFKSDLSADLAASVLAAQPKEATEGQRRILSIAERAALHEGAGGFLGDQIADARRNASDPMATAIAKINQGAAK